MVGQYKQAPKQELQIQKLLAFEKFDPLGDKLSLRKRMEIYRVRYCADDVHIGYARNEYIGEMPKEFQIKLYKKATDKFKSESELYEIAKRKKEAGEEGVGVVWVAYKADKKESGIDKAIRAVEKHIIGETYPVEAMELTRLIARVKEISSWLRELGKKGKEVSKEELDMAMQALFWVRDEFSKKRELFKRVARTAADEALEIAELKFDTKEFSFWLNTLPAKFERIKTALEKRLRSLPNISLFQQGRLDVLFEIRAILQRRNWGAIARLSEAKSKIGFLERDLAAREKTQRRIASFISTIETAVTNGAFRQTAQRKAIVGLLLDFVEKYHTTVKELQTQRTPEGEVIRYGVRGSVRKAASEIEQGRPGQAMNYLKNAVALLDERVKYIKKAAVALREELHGLGIKVFGWGIRYRPTALTIEEAGRVAATCAFETAKKLIDDAIGKLAKVLPYL